MYIEKCCCPICASEDNTPFAFEYVTIRGENLKLGINICASCQLNYISPRLNSDALMILYNEGYSRETVSGVYSVDISVSKNEYIKFTEYVYRFLPQGGKLMDVGCGMGNFLSLLLGNPKYEIAGVEFSEFAGQQAREKGIQVQIGNLVTIDIPDNSYDIVSMLYVLEHVPNPLPMLEKIWKILKPGGVLLVAVPNYNYLRITHVGFLSKLLYGKTTTLHAEEHLQNFTPGTLRRILNKASFESIYWDMAKPFPIGSPLTRMGKLFGYYLAKVLYLLGGIHIGGIHCVAISKLNQVEGKNA